MGFGFLFAFWISIFQDSTIVTTKAILETAIEDQAYLSFENRIDYYQNNSNHIGYLDHLELRTRTRNFDPKEQMYRFRTYTNSPAERKYNRNYLKATFAEQELDKKQQLNKLLKQRYKLIVSSIKNNKILQGKKQLGILLQDRISIYQQNISDLDFDFQDLLKAEEDYDQLILDLIDLERKTADSSQELALIFGNSGKFVVSENDLITILEIEKFIQKYTFEIEEDNFYYDKQLLGKELAELDFLERRASTRNPVKFFEASYRDVFGEGLGRDLAIGIGFRIPVGSAGKGGLVDRSFKIMKEESALQQLAYEMDEEINYRQKNLNTLFQKYKTLSLMVNNDNQQRALEKYQSIEGISPLILLKMKENIIHKQQMIVDLEKEIFDEYIELLDIGGLLVFEPLFNFLSQKEMLNW